MKLIITTAIAAAALCVAACSTHKNMTDAKSDGYAVGLVSSREKTGYNPSNALPKAIVYKTNGNFNDNVPVTLSPDRKEIVAYPAPTDISEASAPIQLDEGYLLDRRGIGQNSAFTKFTYKEYAAMKTAPSIKELKEAIIGGAEIIEIISLPMTTAQAVEQIPACNRLVHDGFPGCAIILQRHAIQVTPQ